MPQVAALAVGDPRCAPPPPRHTVEGVDIEVLHPLNGPDRAAFPELGENDNSLVLRLTYGDVHVLLPGDAEHEGESLLLARGADLSADLLKAPHHGSRTSSTRDFIEAVKPKYVVFCVGLKNQFGFPAPEVDERYAQAKCARYRTDLDGAVTFSTDGREWAVERFLDDSSR
jgi:competence protein ComEC